MNKNSIYLSVGLFVIAGIAGMFYLAFKVSGLSPASSDSTYNVLAEFDNIGGLTTRTKITIAGIKIGRVSKIYLNPKNQKAVVVMSIKNEVNYLTTDTSASVLTAGLLGEKYIGLQVGGDDEMLEEGDLIVDTQGSLVLEDLISKFLVSDDGDDKKDE
jgi:phospholipid/cholesterol/gamma-HCH transport system substrate-binding protein